MASVDPRRLLVLAAVSDRGGVVAAAELLHVTPSAVSQQLARLEREAGVTLVDRSSRQAQLTVAGEQLADRGRRIAHELQAAEADVAEWFGASGSTVVVAAFSTAIKRLLLPMVPSLDAGHDVTLRLVEREARPAVADLHAGTVDVAVVEAAAAGVSRGVEVDRGPERSGRGGDGDRGPGPGRNGRGGDVDRGPGPGRNGRGGDGAPAARLRTALWMEDEYRIAVPADWPAIDWLADGTIVRELARRPWIVSTRGSAGRAAWNRLTEAWEIAPRIAHECNEFASLVALVGAGFGAAVIPHLAWADVTDRTSLLDNDAVEVAARRETGLGVRGTAVLVRHTAKRVPAMELTIAALRRAAEAEQLTVGEG